MFKYGMWQRVKKSAHWKVILPELVSTYIKLNTALSSAVVESVFTLYFFSLDTEFIWSVEFERRSNIICCSRNVSQCTPSAQQCTPFYFPILGALAWNADMLSSGSRDRLILQRDIRTPSILPERRLTGHRQEVCNFLNICCYLPQLSEWNK